MLHPPRPLFGLSLVLALAACTSDPTPTASAEWVGGAAEVPPLTIALRLPPAYAVDVDVTWTGVGDAPGRDHSGGFVDWGPDAAPFRYGVADSNGYRAVLAPGEVRRSHGPALRFATPADSARAVARGLRLDYLPPGILAASGWTAVESPREGVYAYARPVASRLPGGGGSAVLTVEIDEATGLPLLVRTVHSALGIPALTIEKTFDNWRTGEGLPPVDFFRT